MNEPVIQDLASLKKLRGRPRKPKTAVKKPITTAKDEAFCCKCRKVVKVLEASIVLTKNNRKMLKGMCACGMKLSKFVSKDTGM